MSDLSDDADGVQALAASGAVFSGRSFRKTEGARVRDKPCRKCGTMPTRRPLGDSGKEFLICLTCKQQTEPLKSRQALQTMWNGMN